MILTIVFGIYFIKLHYTLRLYRINIRLNAFIIYRYLLLPVGIIVLEISKYRMLITTQIHFSYVLCFFFVSTRSRLPNLVYVLRALWVEHNKSLNKATPHVIFWIILPYDIFNLDNICVLIFHSTNYVQTTNF